MNSENKKMTNLKKLRESRNLTQIKLSVEVAVSQELISAYELGKNKPIFRRVHWGRGFGGTADGFQEHRTEDGFCECR